MRWFWRFQDWWRKYAANTVHVYCYQCQSSQTKAMVTSWQLAGVVNYWKRHADANSHTIQILTWCETPAFFGPDDWQTRNVQDQQYGGRSR